MKTAVAKDYAVSSFGGNAVTAGFSCAKLGGSVHLLTSVAQRLAGPYVFRYGAKLRHRSSSGGALNAPHFPSSFPTMDSALSCALGDDEYLEDFPILKIYLHSNYSTWMDICLMRQFFMQRKAYEQNSLVSL